MDADQTSIDTSIHATKIPARTSHLHILEIPQELQDMIFAYAYERPSGTEIVERTCWDDQGAQIVRHMRWGDSEALRLRSTRDTELARPFRFRVHGLEAVLPQCCMGLGEQPAGPPEGLRPEVRRSDRTSILDGGDPCRLRSACVWRLIRLQARLLFAEREDFRARGRLRRLRRRRFRDRPTGNSETVETRGVGRDGGMQNS